MVERHRVVEGHMVGGEVRRDEAHVRYGTKRTGQLFAAEQDKELVKYRWGCGSRFEGTLGPVQGRVWLADGREMELKEKEKS